MKTIIELHRNPTQSEIKFGYGCTIFKYVPLELLKKKNGKFKKWCKIDGMRYYR